MASDDNKVCNFWRQILSSERIAGTTFQHLRVLLEGGSEQLHCCVPGEASDTRFYPKPRWFSTNQATKSSHSSQTMQTVSCLGENFSSCPVLVFVEFEYSVIYGKMCPTSQVSTLYAYRRHCYQIACSAHPTSTAVTG